MKKDGVEKKDNTKGKVKGYFMYEKGKAEGEPSDCVVSVHIFLTYFDGRITFAWLGSGSNCAFADSVDWKLGDLYYRYGFRRNAAVAVFCIDDVSCFFYGIHQTSVFDLALLMILIMILFSITEKSSIIRLCVITYYLTMCYDFIFVLNHAIEFTALTVTRTLLHLGLVLVSGCLVNLVLKRRKSERVYSDKKIEKLEETNRRVEDFLANVSHELRTPVNAVTGISTVIAAKRRRARKRESSYPQYKWLENDYLVKLKIF